MSSLAYSRAINEPKEFCPTEGKVRVRDAYLFAAPICVKSDSVHSAAPFHDPPFSFLLLTRRVSQVSITA